MKWLDELEIQVKQFSEEYTKVLNKDIPRVIRNNSNQKQWDKELSTNTSGQMTTLAVINQTTLSVTCRWQRSSGVSSPNFACGPTTAAMVANYLKGQGFNVKGESNYSSNGAFINHMYNELGTTFFGTLFDFCIQFTLPTPMRCPCI